MAVQFQEWVAAGRECRSYREGRCSAIVNGRFVGNYPMGLASSGFDYIIVHNASCSIVAVQLCFYRRLWNAEIQSVSMPRTS